jgi:hypothetical protein
MAGGSPKWLTCQVSSRTAIRVTPRPESPDYVFAFHDGDEIGPRMLARIARHIGLQPEDSLSGQSNERLTGNRIAAWTAPRTEGAEALLRIDTRNYDSPWAARGAPRESD